MPAPLAVTVAALPDIAVILGAALVCYGLWLIYSPAGFIAGGGMLLVGTLLGVSD